MLPRQWNKAGRLPLVASSTATDATLSAWIGGVAVFDRALSDDEMKKLATIGNCSGTAE